MCDICGKIGHWHRECPDKGTSKDKGADKDRPPREVHLVQTYDDDFDEAVFCGYLESYKGDSQEKTIEKRDYVEDILEDQTGISEDYTKDFTEDQNDGDQMIKADLEKLDMMELPAELGLQPGQGHVSNASSQEMTPEPTVRHFATVGTDSTEFCQYESHLPLGTVSGIEGHEIFWNEETIHDVPDEACATVDTGCCREWLSAEKP